MLEDYSSAVKSVICEMGGVNPSANWERVEAAVDSAAVDNVIPAPALPHIKTEPSPRSISGRHYVSASDQEIKNRGQRLVRFRSEENNPHSIMFQSADVGRTLISADRLSEAGCEVVLNKKRPRIVTKTGKVIRLKRKG